MFWHKWKTVILVCAIGCLATNGQAGDRLAKAQQLLGDAGTSKRGVAALKRLLRSRDSETCRQARLTLARHYRATNHPEQGRELLASFSGYDEQNLTDNNLPFFLECSLCMVADSAIREGAKMVRFACENTKGHLRVAGMAAKAEQALLTDNPKQAVEEFQECLKYGKTYYARPKTEESDLISQKPGAEQWKEMRPGILARLDEAMRLWDAQRYGQGFAYYRLARKYDLGAKLKDAVTAYELLEKMHADSVYSEAARIYRGTCLLRLGQRDEALEELKAFIKEKPMGMYRGEALEAIGVYYLEHEYDSYKAWKYFSRVLEWVLEARKRDQEVQLYTVPEKAREVTCPPPKALKMYHNRLIPCDVGPRMVINRQTTPWYLDRLYWNACYYRGFLRFVEGQYDSAMDEFNTALAMNDQLFKQHEEMYGSFHSRLQAACRGGRLFLTPEELKAFKGKDLVLFRLGEFYALWERWEDADRIFEFYLKHPRSSRNSQACAVRALAESARYREPSLQDKAQRLYEKLLKDYKGTPSEQPALLEMVTVDQSSLPQQVEWLDRACRIAPNTDTGQKALYMKGFLYHCHGKKAQSIRVLSEFIRRYPQNRFVQLSHELIAEMQAGEPAAKEQPN